MLLYKIPFCRDWFWLPGCIRYFSSLIFTDMFNNEIIHHSCVFFIKKFSVFKQKFLICHYKLNLIWEKQWQNYSMESSELKKIFFLTQSPEINPYIYGRLILEKFATVIHWGKSSLFNRSCWGKCMSTCRRHVMCWTLASHCVKG